MALSPTFQVHPSALFDSLYSFSRLPYPRLHFLRRCSTRALNSDLDSVQKHNPGPKPTPFAKPEPAWIKEWSGTRLRILPKRPQAVVDYRNSISSDDDEVGTSRSTGSSTMEKIVEKLKRFGYIDEMGERKERFLPEKGSVEDIFYSEDGTLPNTKGGLSFDLNEEVRFPWEKPSEVKEGEEGGVSLRRKRSKTSVAELTLPEGGVEEIEALGDKDEVQD